MAKKKKIMVEELDDSDLGMVFPDVKKIDCRDCIYRRKDDPCNVYCEVFQDPARKSEEILWDYEKCAYKVKEEK